MEQKLADLEQKIKVLKKNRDSVPLDVLKSKYAKAYCQLVDDIKELATEVITHYSYGFILIKAADKERVAAKINKAAAQAGIAKKCSRLIFKDYDLGAAIREAENFREQIVEPILEQYWKEVEGNVR